MAYRAFNDGIQKRLLRHQQLSRVAIAAGEEIANDAECLPTAAKVMRGF
jgi:hypothetical protein